MASEQELRDALRRLTTAAWGPHDWPAPHVFTIPPDEKRDADVILGDAITELIETRQQLAQARALLEELTETDPSGYGAESSIRYCPYCHQSEDADEMPVVHAADCPWKRARALFRSDL